MKVKYAPVVFDSEATFTGAEITLTFGPGSTFKVVTVEDLRAWALSQERFSQDAYDEGFNEALKLIYNILGDDDED